MPLTKSNPAVTTGLCRTVPPVVVVGAVHPRGLAAGLGRSGRHQAQAHPLTRDVLDTLLKVCSRDVAGLRDQVLLKPGDETMRRR